MSTKFRDTMLEFLADLTTTFPEYASSWQEWHSPDADMDALLQHCLAVYPERFFDILNKNAQVELAVLPGVELQTLFSCPGITETTRESIWKYLQIVLFLLVSSITDKKDFGPAMNLFEGVSDEELQEKLKQVLESLGAAASSGSSGSDNQQEQQEAEEEEDKDDPFRQQQQTPSMPSFDNIHKHLTDLFHGKIGRLAKELAEDLGEDFASSLDMKDAKTTQEVLQQLMKDPSKVSSLVKTVGEKLNQKMAAGDISQEDIMKEASEMMQKMKEMGGGQDFSNMFKTMAKGMGVHIPKGDKVDPNAFKQFEKKMSMREKVLAKARQRQDKKLAAVVAKAGAGMAASGSSMETMSVDEIMQSLGLQNDVVVKKKKKI